VKHYDVLIATPGSNLESCYVKSLVETLAECTRRNISYKWLNGYSSLVHHARELTATGGDGLELNPDHKGPLGDLVTYNKIFWIDSDIEWTAEQFLKLYDSEYDVTSGAYLLADGVTTTVHEWGNPGGIPKEKIIKMSHPIKVQSIGFGFVAIKSGVFERMKRPWFAHMIQNIKSGSGELLPDSLGEDISWCIRAYQAGIDIMFDPSVLVNHIKKGKVTWG
jgi:hypothetical protein